MRALCAGILGLLSCLPVMGQEMPAAQLRFAEINDAVARSLAGAKSPSVASMLELVERRGAALCRVAPQGAVAGWLAVVSEVDLEQGRVDLMVSPGATVRAMRLPDDPADPRLQTIQALEPGMQVALSGGFLIEEEQCFRQSGPLALAALTNPVFEFDIGAIRLLAEAAQQEIPE